MTASPPMTAEALCENGCGRPRANVGSGSFIVELKFCHACSIELHREEQEGTLSGYRDETTRQLRERLIEDVGSRYARATLATFPAGRLERAQAREDVAAWVAGALAGESSNLLLYGPQGEGKTGLAIAAARELLDRGVGVRYFRVIDWLDAARESCLDDVPGLGIAETATRTAPILVLDDLGTERGTPFALERLFALIDHRYCRRLPTIVTSNFAPSRLVADMGRDDVVGGRIMSRLVQEAVQVRLQFGDLRLRESAAA